MAESVYVFGAVSAVFAFLLFSLEIEHRNSSWNLLNSLPLSRKKTVLAKYIAAILIGLYALIILSIMGFLAGIFFSGIHPIDVLDLLSIFFYVSLYLTLCLPMYFFFNHFAGRFFINLVFLIAIQVTIRSPYFFRDFQPIQIIALLLLSFFISNWLYRRREF